MVYVRYVEGPGEMLEIPELLEEVEHGYGVGTATDGTEDRLTGTDQLVPFDRQKDFFKDVHVESLLLPPV